MSRVAVIGGSGLLGQSLVAQSVNRGDKVLSTYQSRPFPMSGVENIRLNMSDPVEVQKVLRSFAPEFVILPAAMTNVDECERSPTKAWEINAEGPLNVAQTCKGLRVKLLYVSTDYVFNGLKGTEYYEFESPDPISVYGQTKLEGERCVMDADKHNLVCRVSVLYGWNSLKDNFVTWAIKELRQGKEINLFEDQWVSPTYAPHCAEVLLKLVRSDNKGILHTSGPDCMNRYEMGLAIAKEFKLDQKLVKAIKTKDGNLQARRPGRSCLCVDKAESLLQVSMLPFSEGLKQMRASEGHH
ncbi:MAG: dTDP-4-dehydrorhamnose reductase [Methanomassiliicoccales archaeon PtaU1.Bin124]|nr:MAG: dTDP-4-dehydrorhamnose reductase [Methanomassiliicoccales archaeon PtaU1.Bin124]